jgi:inward rectifier potassium channel
MAGMGSTRVFGHSGSGVVVIGLRRRPARDLYHWLVTGPWSRLILVFALVYFATRAIVAIAGLVIETRVPESLAAPLGLAPSLSLRTLLSGALTAVEGFVRWVELVIAAGLMLGKFSLVRARVLFSEVAVVGPHGGGRALMFRMANERSSHLVDARVSVMLVRNEILDGEVMRRAHDLSLSRGGSALFSHAWTAIHPISRESPLAGETARSLEGGEAEIIVNISGYDEALGRTVHARHVYAAEHLRWNARFREIVKHRADGSRAIDYRKFHRTETVEDSPAPAERTSDRRAR